MHSIYNLKPRFQDMLRSMVVAFAKQGVSANQVTIVAVVLSFIGGGFIAFVAVQIGAKRQYQPEVEERSCILAGCAGTGFGAWVWQCGAQQNLATKCVNNDVVAVGAYYHESR